MATYKVIQDIEAEDKLLGPLTLRQFIYAGSCVLFLWLTFLAVTKNAAFMAVLFLPFAGISGFFAWPWSQDQPTEVWALAKIRFIVKPRKRIWNQSGVKDLVTVTAPKKVVAVYSNGLSETEVQSRLKALADTIDSRGWAVKNVNVNMFSQPLPATQAEESDRLISMASLPQAVPDQIVDIQPSEDMLEENNAVSRQFDTMIAASTKSHRDEILKNLQDTSQAATPTVADSQQPAPNYWFLNQPTATGTSVPQDAVTFNTQVVTPGASQEELPVTPGDPTSDEEALMQRLKQEEQIQQASAYNTHWHTIKPLSQQQQAQPTQQAVQPDMIQTQPAASMPQAQVFQQAYQQATQMGYAQPGAQQPFVTTNAPQPTIAQNSPQPKVTAAPDPAILQRASNDDLDVATLARQANRRKEELQDEVVISLH